MIIDSHCHIDFPEFDDDREQVLERAFNVGVRRIIVPGVMQQTWPGIQHCCDKYQHLYPCYGLHPYFIDRHTEQHLTDLEYWLQTKQPIAVGECGLDFFLKELDRNRQHYFFEQQLDLAVKFKLPVVIHARKSTEEVIRAIKQRPSLRGMIHSYSGSYEQAIQLIDLNFYLSFGGPATYPNSKRLRKMILQLPLECILVETDAPDQPVANAENRRNEPACISHVIDSIAELHQVDREEVIMTTAENAQQLFQLI